MKIYETYFELGMKDQIEERSSQLQSNSSTQLKQLQKERLKKTNSGLNRVRTRDLCDAGAVLYQLSYQANWELVIFVNSQYTRKDDEIKVKYMKFIYLNCAG